MNNALTWNPKMQVVAKLIDVLYSLPGCELGGLSHFVIEDGCITDADLKYCMEVCDKNESQIDAELGVFICLMLSEFEFAEREVLLEMICKKIEIDEYSWARYIKSRNN